MSAWSQVAGEYFFDTDPGFGLASAIQLRSGQQDVSISTASLGEGLHTLHLRAVDAEGQWSQTLERTFYVMPKAASQAVSGEYFIDIDRGHGRCTPFGSVVGEKSYMLNVSSLGEGLHTLGFRTKDSDGQWSQTLTRTLFVRAKSPSRLTLGEYFVDTDPGLGEAIPFEAAIGRQSIVFDMSHLSVGSHTLTVRTRDDMGNWSSPQTTRFVVYDELDAPLDLTGAVVAHVSTPGSLSTVLESLGADATTIDRLVVGGQLDATDLALLSTGMPSLSTLDMSEAAVSVIPESFLSGHAAIARVALPLGTKRVKDSAFWGCKRLVQILLPEGLEELEEGVCENCTSLTSIVLPSTLAISTTMFNGCTNLGVVICSAATVPYNRSAYSWYDSKQLAKRTLIVPSTSISAYTSREPYKYFGTIEAKSHFPASLSCYGSLTVAEDYRPDNRPDLVVGKLDMHSTAIGHATVRGTSPLLVGQLTLQNNRYLDDRDSYSYDGGASGTIIAESYVRADRAELQLNVKACEWQFFTPPFDVRTSDMSMEPWFDTSQTLLGSHSYISIKRYSGSRRANGLDAWVSVPSGETLKAGEGYIVQCNAAGEFASYWSDGTEMYDADRMQLTFHRADPVELTPKSIEMTLSNDAAEFAHNRGWNLVGNAYPCWYDTRALNLDGTFVVWSSDRETYKAYSTLDDDYVLAPGEAFFVQCPLDNPQLVFHNYGRQHTGVASKEAPHAQRRRAKATSDRRVLNLSLVSEAGEDATRIVLNPSAELAYEGNRDAAKFMSLNARTPQLYSLEGSVQMAINERPVDNHIVSLGLRIPAAGTYTLRLPAACPCSVDLLDNATGAIISLNREDYTFQAEAGIIEDRFVLLVAKDEVIEMANI